MDRIANCEITPESKFKIKPADFRESGNKYSHLERFRISLGLLPRRETIDIAVKNKERVEKADEFIAKKKEYVKEKGERKGFFTERKEEIEKDGKSLQEYFNSLNKTQKLMLITERFVTKQLLKQKGVDDPEAVISILEKYGSHLICSREYMPDYSKKINGICYSDLLPLAEKFSNIKNFEYGMERLMRLGYDIWRFEFLESECIAEIINYLGNIPSGVFEANISELGNYNFLKLENYGTFQKDGLKDFEYNYNQPSDELRVLLLVIGQSNLDPEKKDSFKYAQRIYDLAGPDYGNNFNVVNVYQKPQFYTDCAVLFEQIASEYPQVLEFSSTLYKNITGFMEEEKLVHLLADLIRDGEVLGEEFIRDLSTDFNYYDGIKDEIKKIIILSKTLKGSENYEYTQAIKEKFNINDIQFTEDILTLVNILKNIDEQLNELDTSHKLLIYKHLSNKNIYQYVPYNDISGEFTSLSALDAFTKENYHFDQNLSREIMRGILKTMILFPKGKTDFELVYNLFESGTGLEDFINKDIVTYLPDQEADFWNLVFSCPNNLHFVLMHLKQDGKDEGWYRDGKMAIKCIEDIVTANNGWGFEGMGDLISEEMLKDLPNTDKSFWNYFKSSSEQLAHLLYANRDLFAVDENNKITSDFFKLVIERDTAYLQWGIMDIITGEVLEAFSPEEKNFWVFLKKCPNTIRLWVYKNKTTITELINDKGQITPLFIKDFKNTALIYYGADIFDLREFLDEDTLSSFPQIEANFWRLWKNSPQSYQADLFSQSETLIPMFQEGGFNENIYLELLKISQPEINEGLDYFITPENIEKFPEENRMFWRTVKSEIPAPVKYFLVANHENFREFYKDGLPTDTLFEGLIGYGREFGTDTFKIFNEEAQAKFSDEGKTIWKFWTNFPSLDFNFNLAREKYTYFQEVRNLIKDSRTLEIINNNPAHKKILYSTLFNDPNNFNKVTELLNNEDLKSFCQEYPAASAINIYEIAVKYPDIINTITLFKDDQIKNFIADHPDYLGFVLNNLIHNFGEEKIGLKEVYQSLQLAAAVKAPTYGMLYNDSLVLASLMGFSTPEESMISYLPDILTAHRDDTFFINSIFTFLRIDTEKALSLIENSKSYNEAMKLLFVYLPFGNNESEFYLGIIDKLGDKWLGLRDKNELKKLIKENHGLNNLLQNRQAMMKLTSVTNAEFSQFIISDLLGLVAYEDDADFSRNGGSKNFTDRRNGWEEKQYNLEQKLQSLNIEKPMIDEVIRARKILFALLSGNKQVSFGKSDFSGEILNGAIEHFKEKYKELTLDDSAAEFEIYHERRNRTRIVPPFETILRDKIVTFYEDYFQSVKRDDIDLRHLFVDCLNLYIEARELYNNIDIQIVPELAEMNNFINDHLLGKGVWFSGRDGIPLYIAAKAGNFGKIKGLRGAYRDILLPQIQTDPNLQDRLVSLALEKEGFKTIPEGQSRDDWLEKGKTIYFEKEAEIYDFLKIVAISRLVFDNLKNDTEKEELRNYLRGMGITEDMIAVDTGYSGRVIKKIYDLLSYNPPQKNIALLKTSSSELTQILANPGDIAKTIETLPKKTKRVLAITGGKAIAISNSPDVQLLAWVVDHTLIRHFAPHAPIKEEIKSIRETRRMELKKELDMRAGLITEQEKKNIIEKSIELYDKTKEYVAPVTTAFADHLLKKLAAKGDNGKLIFVARDGLSLLRAASALLEKFPEKYPGASPEKLKYAYLTRAVSFNSPPAIIKRYFAELGILPADDLMFADIGIYGSIIRVLADKLPEFDISDFEYLISRTSQTLGFIDDGKNKIMNAFKKGFAGNNAVHFMEDTYSGLVMSPSALIDKEGVLIPDTINDGYPLIENLLRKSALWGISDFVSKLTEYNINIEDAIKNLDAFLSEEKNFVHLMVPHS